MAKLQKTTIAACGEHYVSSYLSGLGVVVALTRSRTPATDLIVTSETGGRSVSIQVKTGTRHSHRVFKRKPENNRWVWRVGRKAMSRAKELHWYAFVYIGEWPEDKDSPKVFFVPSKIVAQHLRGQGKKYRDWFVMWEDEAERYCGLPGYRKLKKAIAR